MFNHRKDWDNTINVSNGDVYVVDKINCITMIGDSITFFTPKGQTSYTKSMDVDTLELATDILAYVDSTLRFIKLIDDNGYVFINRERIAQYNGEVITFNDSTEMWASDAIKETLFPKNSNPEYPIPPDEKTLWMFYEWNAVGHFYLCDTHTGYEVCWINTHKDKYNDFIECIKNKDFSSYIDEIDYSRSWGNNKDVKEPTINNINRFISELETWYGCKWTELTIVYADGIYQDSMQRTLRKRRRLHNIEFINRPQKEDGEFPSPTQTETKKTFYEYLMKNFR